MEAKEGFGCAQAQSLYSCVKGLIVKMEAIVTFRFVSLVLPNLNLSFLPLKSRLALVLVRAGSDFVKS